MESLCGWMRVWTARSKSFLQKQRCSWAMGSTRTTLRQITLQKAALFGKNMLTMYSIITEYISTQKHSSCLQELNSSKPLLLLLLLQQKNVFKNVVFPLDNFILQLHICLPNKVFFFKNRLLGFVVANNCMRQTAPSKHPFFLWHTWVSLRSVYLTGALGLHRPITAQEELPTQWGEEPAQAVRDRFGGNAFCTAQKITLETKRREWWCVVNSAQLKSIIFWVCFVFWNLQVRRRGGGLAQCAGQWLQSHISAWAVQEPSWLERSRWGWQRSETKTKPTSYCAGAAFLQRDTSAKFKTESRAEYHTTVQSLVWLGYAWLVMVLKHLQELLVGLGPCSAAGTCLWAVAGSADGKRVLHPSRLSEPPPLYTFPQPDEPASREALDDARSNESNSRRASRPGPACLREGPWPRRTGMSPNWPLLLCNLPAEASSQDEQWAKAEGNDHDLALNMNYTITSPNIS